MGGFQDTFRPIQIADAGPVVVTAHNEHDAFVGKEPHHVGVFFYYLRNGQVREP